jgi:hypothetical protein
VPTGCDMTMKVRISPGQAVIIGARLLGVEVVSARQLAGFAGDQVFELRLPDRVAFLKLAKLLFYAAMFVLSSMAAEFSSGAPSPPFWPATAAALPTILDALDTETPGR